MLFDKQKQSFCLTIFLVIIISLIIGLESAPRPPIHHSQIPGASENEIEENVNEIHDDDKVDNRKIRNTSGINYCGSVYYEGFFFFGQMKFTVIYKKNSNDFDSIRIF